MLRYQKIRRCTLPVLLFFIAVSLSIASIIGLVVKDQAKTSMVSIIIFLPSIMLSGIMFPIELLPKAFEAIGKIFPATWGYKVMTDSVFQLENLLPLVSNSYFGYLCMWHIATQS
ncbi:ABC transporter permease [Massilistercora timonensis]|uniref:ABC transporter permease n=1 Tax=Massilistercora timonensis TaxID=2086584 RepID=UPI00320B1872